jgi:hypothetical protein
MSAIDEFRFEYNADLTDCQILEALDAAPALPLSASPFSGRLDGKTVRLVLDGGAVLVFSFGKQGEVLLEEDGKPGVAAAAGVLELDSFILLAARLPGAMRYIIAVMDTDSRLVTVFFARFGSASFPKREIQREYRFGCLDGGPEAPEERHKTTSRMTGKAILWEDDSGIKLQTIYASHLYSTVVEVGTPSAGDTFALPSDYIALSERHVLYSRVEVEFSGALVLDVIDLFDMKSVGIRLGLDENDALDFRMYAAKGKYLGQLSAYGPFAPQPQEALQLRAASTEIPVPAMAEPGFRPAYRPFSALKPITLEEIDRICSTSRLWVRGFRGQYNESSEKMLPCSDALAGLPVSLRFDDGTTLDYQFIDKHQLRYRTGGTPQWRTERYEAFEADTKLFMVAHMISGSPIHGMTLALDLRDGLVTWFDTYHGNLEHPREPVRDIRFGVIEAEGLTPPKYRRHEFTKELVGHSYTWNYTYSTTSQHIYSSPWSYSWSIMMENGMPGVMWSSPCAYIKVREGVYMVSWIEERSQGGCSTILFNSKTMHDCGTCFGVTFEDEFTFNTFCAEARNAGKLDLSDIYGPCGH